MAAPNSMTRLLMAFRRFEYALKQWLGVHPPQGFQAALVCDIQSFESNGYTQQPQPSTKSILEEIFDSTLLAVPRNRVTAERRRTRKMSFLGHYEYAIPKKNIVACLECGNWHEKETICGRCYEIVKKETEEMQKTMDVNALKYNAPRSEVMFRYEGEGTDKAEFDGKYVVEMKKKRPEWFSKNLMTKASNLK